MSGNPETGAPEGNDADYLGTAAHVLLGGAANKSDGASGPTPPSQQPGKTPSESKPNAQSALSGLVDSWAADPTDSSGRDFSYIWGGGGAGGGSSSTDGGDSNSSNSATTSSTGYASGGGLWGGLMDSSGADGLWGGMTNNSGGGGNRLEHKAPGEIRGNGTGSEVWGSEFTTPNPSTGGSTNPPSSPQLVGGSSLNQSAAPFVMHQQPGRWQGDGNVQRGGAGYYEGTQLQPVSGDMGGYGYAPPGMYYGGDYQTAGNIGAAPFFPGQAQRWHPGYRRNEPVVGGEGATGLDAGGNAHLLGSRGGFNAGTEQDDSTWPRIGQPSRSAGGGGGGAPGRYGGFPQQQPQPQPQPQQQQQQQHQQHGGSINGGGNTGAGNGSGVRGGFHRGRSNSRHNGRGGGRGSNGSGRGSVGRGGKGNQRDKRHQRDRNGSYSGRNPSGGGNQSGGGGGTRSVLCRQLVMKGHCPRGRQCHYSHDREGARSQQWSYILRNWPRHPNELEFIFQQVPEPNSFHFNIVMKFYVRKRNVRAAEGVLARMRSAHVPPDLVTYNTLMKVYGGNSTQAEHILDIMLKQNMVPTLVSWSTLMKSYVGDPVGAERVLRRMQDAGCRPNVQTWSTLMKAYGDDSVAAEGVLRRMLEANVQPDLVTWSTLMMAYRNDVEGAEGVMQRVLDAQIRPDLVTWNTLMKAYVKDNEGARGVLARMQQAGIMPDLVTWSTLMKSYQRDYAGAETVMTRMRQANIEPDLVTWNTLLQSYEENVNGAVNTLRRMLDQGVNPDVVTWSTLCKACRGEPMAARAALDCLQRSHLKPDPATLHALTAVAEGVGGNGGGGGGGGSSGSGVQPGGASRSSHRSRNSGMDSLSTHPSLQNPGKDLKLSQGIVPSMVPLVSRLSGLSAGKSGGSVGGGGGGGEGDRAGWNGGL